MTHKYDNTLATVPTRTVPPGYASAMTVVKRCRVPARREVMVKLLDECGLTGAAALTYFAEVVRYFIDSGDLPNAPSGKLALTETEFVWQRAHDMLCPLVEPLPAHRGREARYRLGLTEGSP